MKIVNLAFMFLFVLTCLTHKTDAKILKIVSSFSTLTSLVEMLISSDDAKVLTLVGPGADPHNFQISLKTLDILNDASLVIVNGLEFEPWLKGLEKNQKGLSAKILVASNGVKVIHNSRGFADPHSFNSPENIKIYINNIASKLSVIIPEKKQLIKNNQDRAHERIDKIVKRFNSAFKLIPQERMTIFTTHMSAQYLCQVFHLKIHSLLGLSSVEALSMKQMNELKEKSLNFKKMTLFVDSNETILVAEKLKAEFNFSTSQRIYLDGLPLSPVLDAISVIEFNLNEILKAVQN